MKELKEKFQAALKAARDLCAKAEGEGRDLSAEERTEVQAKLEEARGLKGQIQAAEGDDALRKAIDQLGDGIGLADPVDRIEPGGFHRREQGKSIGQQFIDSAEWGAFLKQFPGGRIPDKAGVKSLPVGFKTVITGVSDTSAGAFVVTDRTDIVELLGRRPLAIRDIISTRTTGSDLVEYVRQTSRVNAAAPVAEATATSGSSGTKPEGGFALEVVQAGVKTIAEWVPATRRALSDASQLRGLIDQELLADLEEELEDQIMTGDGVGENFTGLLNTANTQSQAWDTNLLTTTRKARTKVRTVGRSIPTAYVLHPNDWERIDLLQDNEARYFFGGPAQLGTPRLWGLPVVESEAITEGTGMVGDFRRAVLWDREQSNISVSDSHADFFIRNMVAILAEMRAAFGVTRPTALVEIDLTA